MKIKQTERQETSPEEMERFMNRTFGGNRPLPWETPPRPIRAIDIARRVLASVGSLVSLVRVAVWIDRLT